MTNGYGVWRCKCPYLVEQKRQGLFNKLAGNFDIFCNINNVQVNPNYAKDFCYGCVSRGQAFTQYQNCIHYQRGY